MTKTHQAPDPEDGQEQAMAGRTLRVTTPICGTAPDADAVAASTGSGGHFLYRYAGVACRTDCPSVAELLGDDWTIEAGPNEWGSFLMVRRSAP